MNDFFDTVKATASLPPNERRDALAPLANRNTISRSFRVLLSGKDSRNLLRALCDLSTIKECASIIEHYMNIHHDELSNFIVQADDSKARKTCAQLMGRIQPDNFSDALINALNTESTEFVLPSIILSLGNAKASPNAENALKAFSPREGPHADEQKLALLKALSSHSSTPPPKSKLEVNENYPLIFFCPSPAVTARELNSMGVTATVAKHPQNSVITKGAFRDIYSVRTFYSMGVLFGEYKSIPAAIEAAGSRSFLSRAEELFKGDKIPFRVEVEGNMPHGERKRIAESVATLIHKNSTFVNSPSAYSFEIRFTPSEGRIFLSLCPSPSHDKRFDYRKENISASVHPAVAASCCRFAADYFKPDANILDCFCGSGTMLFERAHYPYKSLTGTDIAQFALKAARTNERIAKTGAHFLIKNAITPFEQKYDEVICNMPFGLRVSTHNENTRLYSSFMRNLKDILADDGVAFLFTHEKKLLAHTIGSNFTLETRHTFSAGGLFPSLFILKKSKL